MFPSGWGMLCSSLESQELTCRRHPFPSAENRQLIYNHDRAELVSCEHELQIPINSLSKRHMMILTCNKLLFVSLTDKYNFTNAIKKTASFFNHSSNQWQIQIQNTIHVKAANTTLESKLKQNRTELIVPDNLPCKSMRGNS